MLVMFDEATVTMEAVVVVRPVCQPARFRFLIQTNLFTRGCSQIFDGTNNTFHSYK